MGCNVHKSADQTSGFGNALILLENANSQTVHTQCTATESGTASRDCFEISDSDNTTAESWKFLYGTNQMTIGPITLTLDAENAGSEPAAGAGLVLEGGSGTDASLLYDATNDELDFNYQVTAPAFLGQAISTTSFGGAFRMGGAVTIDSILNNFDLIRMNSTITFEQDGTTGQTTASHGIYLTPTLTNDTDETSPDFGGYTAIDDGATHSYKADSGAATLDHHISFRGRPAFTRASGANTDTITRATGLEWVPAVNSNVTATTLRGVHVKTFTGSGTVTTNVGIDIDDIGGSTQIGLRNADTTVFTPPTTQSLAANTDTITCSATFKKLSATAARDLTSDPQVADGQTGQLCILEATGANTITVDDGAGLNVTAQFVMGTSDTLTLIYDGTDWIEVARANN
jgi:hypothetical protein